ncbi:MAG: cyclopropane-fatty-acyl-phospholipid synthase family protein [Verrucomicrobiia bacterium]
MLCYDITAGASNQRVPVTRTNNVSLADAREATPEGKRKPGSFSRSDGIFVPTPEDIVARMLALAEIGPSDVVYDLGSGDGRIVAAAAQLYGSKAVGYEIEEELVAQSRDLVRETGVEKLARIEHADLFTADLSEADVVAVYLPPEALARLVPLLQELKPGARIVSHQFLIPDYPPDRQVRAVSNEDGEPHHLYLWTAPLQKDRPLRYPNNRW